MTRLRSLLFGIAVTMGLLTAAPAQAVDVTITGTVVNTNGNYVEFGNVVIYATCEDFTNDVLPVAFVTVSDATFSATLPAGTYQVLILPDPRMDATLSWNGGYPACAGSRPLTIDSSESVTVVSSNGDPAAEGDPTPAKQSVKKPSPTLTTGKQQRLANRTKQGAKVTWKTKTKKVCTVTKNKVTAKKKGTCKLIAKAPALTGFTAFSKRYTIRVK